MQCIEERHFWPGFLERQYDNVKYSAELISDGSNIISTGSRFNCLSIIEYLRKLSRRSLIFFLKNTKGEDPR